MIALAAWCLMAAATIVLIVLTVSYLTHDPATCRLCVDRAAAQARRRHPAYRGPEDRPEWGHR